MNRQQLINAISELTPFEFKTECLTNNDNGEAVFSYLGNRFLCPHHLFDGDGYDKCNLDDGSVDVTYDCKKCWEEAHERVLFSNGRLVSYNTDKIKPTNKTLKILIGESASGKSYLERLLDKTKRFKKGISHTTRPIRPLEVDGVDYYFISDEEFNKKLDNGEFIEYTLYNGWKYGLTRDEIMNSNIPVVITIEPYGLRQIKALNEFDVTVFYVKASKETRLKRMIDRGDNLLEAFRRIFSDMGVFLGIEKEADYVINNDFYHYSNHSKDNSNAFEQLLDILD